MGVRINNATAVYAIMLALYAAGMWTILAVGSTLRPQPDLAGEWEFAVLDTHGQPAPNVERVTVEQSGRFVRLRFQSSQANDVINLKIKDARRPMPNSIEPSVVLDDASGREVPFDPLANPETYRVTLPGRNTYHARLVTRAHPRPTAAINGPTTAPAATQHAP
jgi:hypothetical protein